MSFLVSVLLQSLKSLLYNIFLSIKAFILRKEVEVLKEQANDKVNSSNRDYADFMREYAAYKSDSVHEKPTTPEPSKPGSESGSDSKPE